MAVPHGKQAFIDYYQQFFPPEEFSQFLQSLEVDQSPILRFNPANEQQLKQLWESAGLMWKTLSWYPYALEWPAGVSNGTILPGYEQHLFYPMNASSLLPVLALNIKPTDFVLDACAAPGGKALFISQQLDSGKLIANDASPGRRQTMRQIFKDYNANIEVWGRPAETIFKQTPNHFDKILLDAPCSSEKHVYNSPKHLKDWSTNRVKQLRQRQVALLSGLLLALKPGGLLVYSTCAITPEENEFVIANILKKRGEQVQLIPWNFPNLPGSEGMAGDYPAEFDLNSVRRIYPHVHNLDPMFVAVLEKE